MISNTFQTNTFIEGMDCDTDITMLPNNRYRYAENIRVLTNDEGTSGVLQGIEGVAKIVGSASSSNRTIIGTVAIDKYIVIIEVDTTGRNWITRYEVNDGQITNMTPILHGYLGLCQDLDKTPNLSIVANYESDDIIKIYFTDGNSSVKVLNILEDKYQDQSSGLIDSNGDIINTEALDITPGATLPPFRLVSMGIGSLPSGVVQYCYQLFNLRNSETTTSPLSNIMHLTSSSTSRDSQYYEGSNPNESSNKSITLQADLITKDFQKCRIIRILYTTNNQPPTFTIVNEINISTSQSTIEYIDDGNSFMGSLTVDEFNALTGYQFIGSSLAKLQNRLFIADITEDTWNPGYYDARAYRCNPSGQVVLQSSDSSNTISFNIDSYDLSNIPQQHDCINPYNLKDLSECSDSEVYAYGIKSSDGRLLGGHGINVDYTFVEVPIELSKVQESLQTELLDNDCSMNVESKSMSSMPYRIIGEDSWNYTGIQLGNGSKLTRIPNYSDPDIDSRFKGYQRDEIYRFGIIFYNSKSIPSPVYWIGDIKFPHSSQIAPFYYSNQQLKGSAIGIKFTVKNIPDGAMAYEIVRCDRTENDRSVVMQVVGQFLYRYNIQERGEYVGVGDTSGSSIEMRPPVMFFNQNQTMAFSGGAGVFSSSTSISERVDDYFRVVSPEICLQQEDSEQYITNGTYLEFLGSYISPVRTGWTSTYNNKYSVTATAKKILSGDGTTHEDRTIPAYVEYQSDSMTDVYVSEGAPIVSTKRAAYGVEIAKYFIPDFWNKSSIFNGGTIVDAVYPPMIPYNSVYDVSPYRVNIGDRTYTNYSMTEFDVSGQQTFWGSAGPCIVLHIPDLNFGGFGTPFKDYDIQRMFNRVPIFNVKRKITSAYGGNTYTSRQNSIYISTNSYRQVNSASSSFDTFTYGGDTYLGVLDYPNTFIFQSNTIDDRERNKRYFGSYIPFETSINMNLFSGDMPHRTYTSDNFIDGFMQMEPQQTQNIHVQDEPFFVYNGVYSSQSGAKIFAPKSIYAQDNVHINNRILVSQAKTNNEILDNWTQFKVADYLDIDNQYGNITNLYTFKDKLFYFQNSAVGIASVNERSLITDGNSNQLVLGTGGILSRFDYITTINGTSIRNDRSIINSDNVLYWYDYDKNEVCAYNGGVNSISKEKNVQSYLNEMYTKKRNVNLAFFDKKYNEVWFKFYDKSLIFNEQLGRFTSFYTFNPDWILQFSYCNIAIKDYSFYRINSLDTDGLGLVDKTAKIQIIINKDAMFTKTFDNIVLSGELKDKNNANLISGLITNIEFNTKHQQSEIDNPTFDYRENSYRLPIPRQNTNNDPASYPARLRGKCLTCDYTFNTNDENTFKIPYITTTYRYSLI